MSVPQEELVKMLKKGAAQPEQAAATSDPTSPNQEGLEVAPSGSPLQGAREKKGKQASANIKIQMALDMLQAALPAYDNESKEGQQILQTIEGLSKVFGAQEAKTREFMPAEILAMIQSLPQAGGATPEAKAMQSAPIPGMGQAPSPM